MARHRTNIELDLDSVEIIMERYNLHTKTDAVNMALRSLAGRRLTTEEVLAMRGRRLIGTIPADVGPRGAE